jgi:phosphoserine phosphatase
VTRFASVVLDVDSTLADVEGIEWLAERRGPSIARAVADMTVRAMDGTVPLDAVYGARLGLVQPARADIVALAELYVERVVPGAADALGALRAAGVRLVVVSGGVREAVLPFAVTLGVDAADVHAVCLRFADDGSYAGFDEASPLARRGGKADVVRSLALRGPVLAVGDGHTDAELRPVVAAFAAFTGVVRRESVVAAADCELARFVDLPGLVL